MIEELRNYPVYLVDDDEAVLTAVQLLLKTAGISTHTYGDARDFLRSIHTLSPGCIVLDIRMPAISGIKLQEQLAEYQIAWPVIIISGHGNIEACRTAFKNGAMDFFSKPIDEQDLIDAVQKAFGVLEKEQLLLAEREELEALLSKLTKREHQVLDLVTQGYSTKECADALSLSPRTVETHRAHISSKLGTNSLAELALIANAIVKTL